MNSSKIEYDIANSIKKRDYVFHYESLIQIERPRQL